MRTLGEFKKHLESKPEQASLLNTLKTLQLEDSTPVWFLDEFSDCIRLRFPAIILNEDEFYPANAEESVKPSQKPLTFIDKLILSFWKLLIK